MITKRGTDVRGVKARFGKLVHDSMFLLVTNFGRKVVTYISLVRVPFLVRFVTGLAVNILSYFMQRGHKSPSTFNSIPIRLSAR